MSNKTLTFIASLDLQAGEKTPRFEGVVYTGGIMVLSGWGPVVVDLAGLELPGKLPLLFSHNEEAILGHGEPSIQRGKLLMIEAVLSFKSELRDNIVQSAKAGLPWGLSLGAESAKVKLIRAGEEIRVNERMIKANQDLTLIMRSRLREISVVSVGADDESGITKLAAKKANNSTYRSFSMFKKKNQTQQIDNEPTASELLAEFEEITEGLEAAAVVDLRSRYLDGAIDETGLRAECFERMRNQTKLIQMRAQRPSIRGITGDDAAGVNETRVLEAAVMLALGRSDIAQKSFDARTLNLAEAYRIHSLADLAGRCLKAEGRDVTGKASLDLKAAFSTVNLPTILDSVSGKVLLSLFEAYTANWRSFVKILPVNDFKVKNVLRLDEHTGTWELIPSTGEIKHGALTESAREVQASTYAQLLAVSRTALINDDLNALAGIPEVLARGASDTVQRLLWTVILGNAGSFFSGANGNLMEAGSALSVTTLGTAIKTIFQQTRTASGEPISIQPRCLVVSPSLQQTAAAILNSTWLWGDTAGQPSANPITGQNLSLIVEPRIENANYTGHSSTAWFLFGAADAAAVVCAALNGVLQPVIESDQTQFNTLGVQFRGYLDVGVALGECKSAVMATGLGE